MSLVTLLLAALVVGLATMIQSTLGFGAGLFLVSVGALMVPIHALLPAYVPLDILASAYLAWRYREHIHWRLLLTRVLPLMAIGTPLGVVVFDWTSEELLKGAVGVGIGLLSLRALYGLYHERRAAAQTRNPAPTPDANDAQPTAERVKGPSGIVQAIALFVAGIIHGATGTAGPILIYASEASLPNKATFRSTFCTIWTVMGLVRFASLLAAGRYTGETFTLTMSMFVAMPIGLVLGQKLHAKLPVESFRVLVYVVLAIASGLLIASAL